ncbi:MAG: FAD:protein FMN transferase [Desulfobacterales bacterium]|nr:FAD:protein FMN transferase [Desulfobacterales bacterium]
MSKNKKEAKINFVFLTLLFVLIIINSVFILIYINGKNNKANVPTKEIQNASPIDHLLVPIEIKPSWWEENRKIYKDIPARILFKLPQNAKKKSAQITKEIWDEFDRIGKIFNPFSMESEIGNLNFSIKTFPVKVSSDVIHMLNTSSYLWMESDMEFDPTILPIKKIWSSGEKHQIIPTDANINVVLEIVGFNKVHFDNSYFVSFDSPFMQLDFGGIVKGFAVDNALLIMKNNGIESGLIQIGGEISAFGLKDGEDWNIGIQNPKKDNSIWGIVSNYNSLRVSTSGNYRQPIIIQDSVFYHIFSPTTGMPVSTRVIGVTTACFDSTISNAVLDGAATAITVLGAQKGIEFAKKIKVEALIIVENENAEIKEIMTEEFYKRYKRTQ